MTTFIRSFATATFIAAAVLVFTVHVVAPILPPVVGPPDLIDTKKLTLPKAERFHLTSADGPIRIRTHPNTDTDSIVVEATIKVYLRPDADKVAAKKHMASLVEAFGSPSELKVISEPHERPAEMDIRVDYAILLPAGTDVDISGSNGNIWISKGCGEVAVRGDNSDIEIKEPTGMVTASNINGRIRVLDARRGARIATTNGNIYAHMLGGALEANAMNGHIVTRVLSGEVDGCDLKSQNGGITIVLLDNPSATVQAESGRGLIRCDFDVENEFGAANRKRMRSIFGEGHTQLNAETVNGNIWIARG